MNVIFKNNDGMSTVYVIMTLIITGLVGTSMIKMSTSDRFSRAIYSSSATARLAAKSGIIAATSEIQKESNTNWIIAELQSWIDETENSAQMFMENFITDNGDISYKTDLLAFDDQNFNITLHSKGKGKNNARSDAFSVVHLEGLEYKSDLGQWPINALQMDNGNFEFNCELIVDGDVGVFDKMTGNNGPYTFNGNFRIDAHRSTGAISTTTFNKGVTINGNAYFEGPIEVWSNDPIVINGSAAFEDRLSYKAGLFEVSGEELYFNNGASRVGSGSTNIGSADIKYFSGAIFSDDYAWDQPITSFFSTTGTIEEQPDSITNLDQKVGFTGASPKVNFNYEKILAEAPAIKVHNDGTSITSSMFQSWYDSYKSAGMLYQNTFLVVHVPESYFVDNGKLFNAHDNPFDGKAIVIVETSQFTDIYLNTTDNANVALYLKEVKDVATRCQDFENFRGFIYVEKVKNASGNIVFQSKQKNCHYKGAIYAAEDARTKFNAGSKSHHISFDAAVVEELGIAGVFTDPNSNDKILTLKDNYSSIKPVIISHHM